MNATTTVVLALCTYRLTRLVVADDVTVPFREWVRDRNTREVMVDVAGHTVGERFVLNRRRPVSWFLHRVSQCFWCASIWLGASVSGLWYWQPFWFYYVALALALSAVAGLISERV